MSQNTVPSTPILTKTEIRDFHKIIDSLKKIGAISECAPCMGQFISSTFLVPKPNGKKRLILNLKILNTHIQTDHFKIEDLRTAVKLMTQNCYMATCDLKDAYFTSLMSYHLV